jgi:excisionase family DNA binding protein
MADSEMKKEIVTIRELASYLHCHPSTIYRLAKNGQIPAFRLGGSWRFRIDDVNSFLQQTMVRSERSLPQVGRTKKVATRRAIRSR